MIKINNTLLAIKRTIPYWNLVKAVSEGELIEDSKPDQQYVNKVAHVQGGQSDITFPVLAMGQFKIDEENTRTLTMCICNVVELRNYLTYLYEFYLDVIREEDIEYTINDYFNDAKELFNKGAKNVAEMKVGDHSKFIEFDTNDCEIQILLKHAVKLPGHLFLCDAKNALVLLKCYQKHYCREKKTEFLLELGRLISKLDDKDDNDPLIRDYVFAVERYLNIDPIHLP